jgi:tetratricopeptide (TPR) repeat protein
VRRDLLITALLFTAIGFAGGYVYSLQGVKSRLQPVVQPAPSSSAQNAEGLPEGHPPLEAAQRWRSLQEKAEANPNDPAAALELANLLYDLQRWDVAVTWYERALTLDAKNTNARTDLATCYFNLNRFDKALAEYERALRDEPDKPQALYGLALSRLHGQQDRAGARRALEQLRRTHPDFSGIPALEQALKQAGPVQ